MLGSAPVQQSIAFFDRCWTQVHVPLRGRQVCIAAHFLNRRYVTEAATEDMHTGFWA